VVFENPSASGNLPRVTKRPIPSCPAVRHPRAAPDGPPAPARPAGAQRPGVRSAPSPTTAGRANPQVSARRVWATPRRSGLRPCIAAPSAAACPPAASAATIAKTGSWRRRAAPSRHRCARPPSPRRAAGRTARAPPRRSVGSKPPAAAKASARIIASPPQASARPTGVFHSRSHRRLYTLASGNRSRRRPQTTAACGLACRKAAAVSIQPGCSVQSPSTNCTKSTAPPSCKRREAGIAGPGGGEGAVHVQRHHLRPGGAGGLDAAVGGTGIDIDHRRAVSGIEARQATSRAPSLRPMIRGGQPSEAPVTGPEVMRPGFIPVVRPPAPSARRRCARRLRPLRHAGHGPR
jgi:hypothetical protein